VFKYFFILPGVPKYIYFGTPRGDLGVPKKETTSAYRQKRELVPIEAPYVSIKLAKLTVRQTYK